MLFLWFFVSVFLVGLARRGALRARRASVYGAAEGKAHDGGIAPLALLDTFLSDP